MSRTPALAALAIALVIAAGGSVWWFALRDRPPECPGESPYCDRGAYVATTAAACTANMSPRERPLIERETTIEAYCTCMAGKMFGAFDAAALWRLDSGAPSGSERMLIQSQAETWAGSCMAGN